MLRLFTDGAARGNPGPAGLGLVIEDSTGQRLWGGCRFIGTATNNQAEYLALIEGLQRVGEWQPERLEVYLDSLLVVEQMRGRYRVKAVELKPLHRQARALLAGFSEASIAHVRRENNRGADALANKAIDEYRPTADAPARAAPGSNTHADLL
ncbi:MAG: ribonuclease HI family protein [Candidatus Dormibacteraeota bacterium]|nr:ribonuclease HI family protein [Candidatus Dormibacteraeota bacterium]